MGKKHPKKHSKKPGPAQSPSPQSGPQAAFTQHATPPQAVHPSQAAQARWREQSTKERAIARRDAERRELRIELTTVYDDLLLLAEIELSRFLRLHERTMAPDGTPRLRPAFVRYLDGGDNPLLAAIKVLEQSQPADGQLIRRYAYERVSTKQLASEQGCGQRAMQRRLRKITDILLSLSRVYLIPQLDESTTPADQTPATPPAAPASVPPELTPSVSTL